MRTSAMSPAVPIDRPALKIRLIGSFLLTFVVEEGTEEPRLTEEDTRVKFEQLHV